MATRQDLVTFEVIRESLIAVVREMRSTMIRTSYSSVIYEGQDFSCVIVDASGRLVAMSPADHPGHIIPIPMSVQAVLAKFGQAIYPGDVFIHNDPYTGGTHLNDVALILPVFLDSALFCFAVARCHWADIGGMTPGSLSGQATEIYQEGIRIPVMRVYERGTPNAALLELLLANVRNQHQRRGDFHAALASCERAATKIREVVNRRGITVVGDSFAYFIEEARSRMEERLGRMRPGAYSYEAYIESTGVTSDSLRVSVDLHIGQGRLLADFSRSDPQSQGPTNVGPAAAPSGVFTIVKSYSDPTSPINHGAFDPITVDTPPGTLLNAAPPAACGGYGETRRTLETAVMGALSAAAPEEATGDSRGSPNHVYIGGVRSDGSPFLYYEYPAGGTGAYHGGDGNNASRGFQEGDFASIQPVEAIENEYPLRVLRSGIREKSAGIGRWRGGYGIRREVEVLAQRAVLSVLSDRNLLAPHGVCGGYAAFANKFSVLREGREVAPSAVPGKVSGFRLARGDIVVMETCGGGGYGDPLERSSSHVLSEVTDGYLDQERAAAWYGVVITAGGVDEAETERMRQRLRSVRAVIEVRENEEASDGHGRRPIALTAATARRVGVRAGDVVEVVNPRGAPLRAWVEIVAGRGLRAFMGGRGLAIVSAQSGDRLWIRPLVVGGLPRALP